MVRLVPAALEPASVTVLAGIGAGDVPGLARAKHVEYVDIDSGHWPMFSQPAELARLIASVAVED